MLAQAPWRWSAHRGFQKTTTCQSRRPRPSKRAHAAELQHYCNNITQPPPCMLWSSVQVQQSCNATHLCHYVQHWARQGECLTARAGEVRRTHTPTCTTQKHALHSIIQRALMTVKKTPPRHCDDKHRQSVLLTCRISCFILASCAAQLGKSRYAAQPRIHLLMQLKPQA